MTSDVHSIVQELIAFDPSLEPHRAMLEERITAIAAARPDMEPRAEFRTRLLTELRAHVLAQDRAAAGTSSSTSFLLLSMQRFLLAGGGAVLGGLLVFVALQYAPSGIPSLPAPSSGTSMMDEEAPPADLGREAFGALQNADGSATAGRGGGGAPEMDSQTAMQTEPAKMMVGGGGGDAMILPYNPVTLEFAYAGEVALPEGDVEVLRRRGVDVAAGAAGSVTQAFQGLFDWSAIPGLRVSYANLVQDRDLPYSVNVNLLGGTLDISKTVDYRGRENAPRMTEAMMPDSAAVIAIADGFLDRFGIDREGYGAPEMQDDWRFWYLRAENQAEYWLPDMLTVLYPMEIDGKPVYDEYGNAVGIGVSVDIRDKVVTSVYGIQTRSFDRSSYAGASDSERVAAVLKAGGVNMWQSPDGERLQATLGEPAEAYVRISRWDDRRSTSEDLYVPALAFPVTELPEKAEQPRKRVILPLAAEMLTLPNPEMMPLMMQ